MRSIEEYLLRHSQNNIIVRTTVATALYVLNHKRQNLADLEARFGLTISIEADDSVGAQHFAIDKGSIALGPIVPLTETPTLGIADDFDESDPVIEDTDDDAAEVQTSETARSADNDDASRKRKRKRRRRGGRDRQESAGAEHGQQVISDDDDTDQPAVEGEDAAATKAREEENERRKKRRRGRRGGRKNKRFDDGDDAENRVTAKTVPDAEPVFVSIPLPDFSKPKTIEAIADAAEAASVPVTADVLAAQDPVAIEEILAKKPAKRRSRSKAGIEAAEIAVAEVLAEAEPEAPVKPKRAPRKSAKKADAPVATETSEPAATVEPVEAKVESAVKSKPAPAPKVVEVSTPVVTSTGKEKKSESEPAKKGWWQKKGFF